MFLASDLASNVMARQISVGSCHVVPRLARTRSHPLWKPQNYGERAEIMEHITKLSNHQHLHALLGLAALAGLVLSCCANPQDFLSSSLALS